eukprot:scaffold898_cov168-Amphora_coffeaeformis.AAC.1
MAFSKIQRMKHLEAWMMPSSKQKQNGVSKRRSLDNSAGSITSTGSYSESWGQDCFISATTGNEKVGSLKSQYSRRSSLGSYRNTKSDERRSELLNQTIIKSSQSCRGIVSSSRSSRPTLATAKNRKHLRPCNDIFSALHEEDTTTVASLDCSTIFKLQESWKNIKKNGDYQATLAECLIRKMMGVNAQRVGEVLVESIRDLVSEDAFSEDLEKAWNATVINVIRVPRLAQKLVHFTCNPELQRDVWLQQWHPHL